MDLFLIGLLFLLHCFSGLSSDEENRPTDSRRLEMNTHLDHLSKEVSNREVPRDSTHRNNQHLSRADSG